MTTPYNNDVFLWHWKGDSLAEQTIEDVVRTLKTWAPHVSGLFVKTTDGTEWMGTYDTNQHMAINGTASIRRWAQVLNAEGLEFHAWCVPQGQNVFDEVDLIVQTCLVEGVESMILDVEPYAGFWQGGKDNITPFMQRLRRGVGGDFHLGLSVDPRRHHYDSVFPSEWRPYVNSLHPQVYWDLFERDYDEVLDEVYATWSGYGLPIFPVLQGNAPLSEMISAREYSINHFKAKGLSWWRLGVLGVDEFAMINHPIVAPAPPPPEEPPEGDYGLEILVTPDSAGFQAGTHSGQPIEAVFNSFTGTWGWPVLYKNTAAASSEVWARWDPNLTVSGWYEVSVFVSTRHADTNNARYKLHGVQGESGETLLPVEQGDYFNLWVVLGIYQFDANNSSAGVMFLNDLTGESDKSIGFDAVRYRQIVGRAVNTQFVADGFDAPVGTAYERQGETVWPGNWYDATGYGSSYDTHDGTAYHSGADLNLDLPYFDADAHSPIYAAASGVVTFAQIAPGWGRVVVIRHDPLLSSGEVVYSRYGHVEDVQIKAGDRVQRGQQIARIGNADGLFPYHLHFDISPTDRLEQEPWDDPGTDLDQLKYDYVDPKVFVEENRPETAG